MDLVVLTSKQYQKVSVCLHEHTRVGGWGEHYTVSCPLLPRPSLRTLTAAVGAILTWVLSDAAAAALQYWLGGLKLAESGDGVCESSLARVAVYNVSAYSVGRSETNDKHLYNVTLPLGPPALPGYYVFVLRECKKPAHPGICDVRMTTQSSPGQYLSEDQLPMPTGGLQPALPPTWLDFPPAFSAAPSPPARWGAYKAFGAGTQCIWGIRSPGWQLFSCGWSTAFTGDRCVCVRGRAGAAECSTTHSFSRSFFPHMSPAMSPLHDAVRTLTPDVLLS